MCDDPAMVEYGNGVGQVSGQSGGGGGGPLDVGASIGQFVSDTAHTIQTLPLAGQIAVVVIFLVGLVILRRAF
jgi:hypothetical protein